MHFRLMQFSKSIYQHLSIASARGSWLPLLVQKKVMEGLVGPFTVIGNRTKSPIRWKECHISFWYSRLWMQHFAKSAINPLIVLQLLRKNLAIYQRQMRFEYLVFSNLLHGRLSSIMIKLILLCPNLIRADILTTGTPPKEIYVMFVASDGMSYTFGWEGMLR
jgi:hypothetical protein